MRAVGIVRQSRGREESLSPAEQRDRIAAHCEREGWELLAVHEEIDVSGGTPLERRRGLRSAVEAVEAGRAQVVVVAYFDRLFRSLRVQGEVVGRVEAAGGQLLALDFGALSERTAAAWISGTMMGVVSEYYRRSVRERAGAAQERAVARGVAPFPNVPPGYLRGTGGVLVPDPATSSLVARAFALRAEGATIAEVRGLLRDGGVERSYHGVQALLGSRLVLGEIHFGELVNLAAHEPIVERAVWGAVQRRRGMRGGRAPSDRLLARLGVLRCSNCGARMSAGTQTQGGRCYPFYRCSPVGDCDARVAISATIAEEWTVARVRERLAGIEESATLEAEAVAAGDAAERAQRRLDAAIRTLAGIEEPASAETLAVLRDERDALREQAHRLSGLHAATTLSAARDWERLTLGERRALIAASVERVEVGPGRGAGRLSVTFRE